MFISTIFFGIFNTIFGNHFFIFFAEVISFLFKGTILVAILRKTVNTRYFSDKRSTNWLSFAIFLSLLSNFSWILEFLVGLGIASISEQVLIIVSRLAWSGYIIYYPAITIFIESLIRKGKRLNYVTFLIFFINTILAAIYLLITFFYAQQFEIRILYYYIIQFLYLIVIPICSMALFFDLQNNTLPKILGNQVKLIVFAIIIPQLIFEFLQAYPLDRIPFVIGANNESMIGFSVAFNALLIYYCAKKILKLRFLNINSITQTNQGTIDFLEKFKEILNELSQTSKLEELNYVTKLFFKKAFNIEQSNTKLCLKQLDDNQEIVQTILKDVQHENLIFKNSILVRDEIEFSNFYDNTLEHTIKIGILNALHADIFLPIFHKNNILGYITIEKGARKKFFSKIETDQIIVFSNYLASIVDFINARNLSSLIKNEKEIKEELYNKHQEINQYKESLRYFLTRSDKSKLGIVFYKNRRYSFANKEGGEILPHNLNMLEGHPTVKKIKNLTRLVQQTNSIQYCFAEDVEGAKIKIIAIPIEDSHNIMFIAHYPELFDLLKDQINLLKDPSDWDYLLYLETTESGKLINRLIPSSSQTFINFKIDLLKISLSKKAILLHSSDEDMTILADIIHNINLKEVMHTLELKSVEKNNEIAIKLFGINPIFGTSSEEPLLKKLDKNGTLLIKNIHFLSIETQDLLAEFLRYGYFRVFKSDQKIATDVRIICSSNNNLKNLVQENSFSKDLFEELRKTHLKMPSLVSLDKKEMENLTNSLSEQAIQSEPLKRALELSEKEKSKIIDSAPISLVELKKKVEKTLISKSRKVNIYEEAEFNPEFNLEDPVLFNASKLGKKALKDPAVLAELWNKFKNQNKIATFLGVNRSSISRRFKDYKISIE